MWNVSENDLFDLLSQGLDICKVLVSQVVLLGSQKAGAGPLIGKEISETYFV